MTAPQLIRYYSSRSRDPEAKILVFMVLVYDAESYFQSLQKFGQQTTADSKEEMTRLEIRG